MLVNGKKINKGANEEDYDTGCWYHVICEGSLYVCKVYVDGDSDHRGERVWTTMETFPFLSTKNLQFAQQISHDDFFYI